MENRKICAVFGENQNELEFGYDEEDYMCAQMKLRLVCGIRSVIESGCSCFASTLEQGAAMWAGEACAAIKELGGDVCLIAAPTGDEQATRWHPERRERYFDLLCAADRVIESDEDVSGEDYIFENAGLVLILGDISHPRLANVQKRAVENGIAVINI